jgi:hypothetical protein
VWTQRGVTPRKKVDAESGELVQQVYRLRLIRASPAVEAAAAAAAAAVPVAAGGGGAGAVANDTEKEKERAAVAAARATRISLLAAAAALGDAPLGPEEEPDYMWYIGITSDPPVRMDVHYREQGDGGVEGVDGEGSGGGGDTWFTKIHHVDRTYRPQFFQVPKGMNGRFLEDAVVKDTMAQTGVGPEKVRGGTYTARHFSGNSLDVIAQETRHAQELCLNCGEADHMASECNAPRSVQNTARDLGEAKGALTSVVGALRDLLKAGTMDQDGVFAVMDDLAVALRHLGISGAPPPPPPVL